MQRDTQPRRDRGIRLPHFRAWRLYAALTQNQLAASAKVARSTIIRAEMSKPISIPNAQKLAKALGLTVQQLRDEEPDSTHDVPAA